MEQGKKLGLIGLFLGIGAIVCIILELTIVVILGGTPQSLMLAYILIVFALVLSIAGLVLSIKALRVIESSNIGIAGIIICSLIIFIMIASVALIGAL